MAYRRNQNLGLLFTLLALPAAAASTYNEDHYNKVFCKMMEGRAEVTLKNGSRADCLTDTYAIEADWSNKWAEAYGQAMNYAAETGKKPAILFLRHEKSLPAHLYRLEQTIEYGRVPVEIFVLEAPKK